MEKEICIAFRKIEGLSKRIRKELTVLRIRSVNFATLNDDIEALAFAICAENTTLITLALNNLLEGGSLGVDFDYYVKMEKFRNWALIDLVSMYRKGYFEISNT